MCGSSVNQKLGNSSTCTYMHVHIRPCTYTQHHPCVLLTLSVIPFNTATPIRRYHFHFIDGENSAQEITYFAQHPQVRDSNRQYILLSSDSGQCLPSHRWNHKNVLTKALYKNLDKAQPVSSTHPCFSLLNLPPFLTDNECPQHMDITQNAGYKSGNVAVTIITGSASQCLLVKKQHHNLYFPANVSYGSLHSWACGLAPPASWVSQNWNIWVDVWQPPVKEKHQHKQYNLSILRVIRFTAYSWGLCHLILTTSLKCT